MILNNEMRKGTKSPPGDAVLPICHYSNLPNRNDLKGEGFVLLTVTKGSTGVYLASYTWFLDITVAGTCRWNQSFTSWEAGSREK